MRKDLIPFFSELLRLQNKAAVYSSVIIIPIVFFIFGLTFVSFLASAFQESTFWIFTDTTLALAHTIGLEPMGTSPMGNWLITSFFCIYYVVLFLPTLIYANQRSAYRFPMLHRKSKDEVHPPKASLLMVQLLVFAGHCLVAVFIHTPLEVV